MIISGRKIFDGTRSAVVNHRGYISLGWIKSSQVPARLHATVELSRLRRVTGRRKSYREESAIRFRWLSNKLPCASSKGKILRVLPPAVNACRSLTSRAGKVMPCNILAGGILAGPAPRQSSRFRPFRKCILTIRPDECERLKQRAARGISSRESGLSKLRIRKLEGSRDLMKIPAEQSSEQAARHDKLIPVFREMESISAGHLFS